MKLTSLLTAATIAVLPFLSSAWSGGSNSYFDEDSGTSDDDSTPCSIEDLEGKDFLFSIYPSVFGFGGYLFREPVLLC